MINDCAGYWQTSFYNAITTWNVGSADDWAVIEAWKAKRNDFVLPLEPELIDYNVLECKLLAELMTKLDQTAMALGIRLERYHGAGTLAEALLKKHGVDAFRSEDDSHPSDLDLAIRCAFFGGRFESAVVGIVPTLHVWDIASAYPAAMVTLPCLRHGHWIHHEHGATAHAAGRFHIGPRALGRLAIGAAALRSAARTGGRTRACCTHRPAKAGIGSRRCGRQSTTAVSMVSRCSTLGNGRRSVSIIPSSGCRICTKNVSASGRTPPAWSSSTA